MIVQRLYFYQCQRCKTAATAPIEYPKRELTCILCRSHMRLMWADVVTTPAQRALFDRGVVFNPGTSQERDPYAT
jgi:hypothetical protein